MKIAVCDDSREARGALRELLEVCGHDFEIREYGSGGEDEGGMPESTYRLVTVYVNYALDKHSHNIE